ncbi:MAG: alpha-glucosidase/alpha-galactosidase, partial [Chloroflexi bacterium]|nr:alpha-glucosidase/alpha-galactosidase [Chloroflexota bacterium]
RASAWDVTVRGTTDRLEALPGADFVVTSIARDRDGAWATDHRLAMRYGFPSVLSENGGPGGLSHTLRAVPPVLAVAQDMERLAPAALLLNYTNPENRVCLAVHTYTGVRSIGLCHGVAETVEFVAQTLGVPRDEIDLRAAGVNHFTWTVSLTQRPSGRDLVPELRAALGDDPPSKWRLCAMLYDRFGVFPTTGDDHVGEYIGWAAEVLGTEGYNFKAYARNKRLAGVNLDAWADGSKPVDSLLRQPSREARLGHAVTEIIAALASGRTVRRPSFIIPNDGYIENLDRDAVVEVPGVIEDGDYRGLAVGPLAGPVASMVAREIEIQRLAVEAAVTGSRRHALEALLIDPCVHSARAAESFLDDILVAHREHLPAFWLD